MERNEHGSDSEPSLEKNGRPRHSAAPAILLSPSRRVWSIAITAGLVAGLLAWLGGEIAYGVFHPRTFEVQILGMTSLQPTIGTVNAADYKNATLAFAILGGATGLVLGLAGGLAAGSPRRGLGVGLAGLLAGAAVGAAASLAILRFYYRGFTLNPNDLVTPIMTQGGIWTAIGALGGAAFALGAGLRRQVSNAIAGACIGAMLATLLFQVLSQSFFPNSNFGEPLASSPAVRLMARVLVTLLVAIGAARESLRSAAAQVPSSKPLPAGR